MSKVKDKAKDSESMERHCFLTGICPDEHCQAKLYFPSYDSSVECTNCGQRHPRDALRSVTEVTDPEVALHNMVRNLLMGNCAPKKTTDTVKVLGLSNYHCKLLSPLLTSYGMDKQGIAQPLQSLNKDDVFDCANLSDRTFLIQPEHVDIMGYGRDQTGSARYLCNTLEQIKSVNGGAEVLIPIHADGDGHCLVHGISRALVGRELFWHALRTNLKAHFEKNLTRYMALFRDFVDKDEWPHIIAESDPDYLPGPNEAMGLQNIHIFGLANVLRRPIVLLDSLSGLQSFGDYSGVFLPIMHSVDECRGKDGKLNKPLCVAWSSSGRNHFIALVGVKGRPLPRLPRWMLSKAWGTPQEAIDWYIDFDTDGMCTVGGDRALPEKYVQRLATAMEGLFLQKHGVHPSLVSDVYNYIYKRTGVVGVHQDVIIQRTRLAVSDHQVYRCLICNAVSQVPALQGHTTALSVPGLKAGGSLYQIALQAHGPLKEGRIYKFPDEDLQCTYDASTNELVPDLTFKQAVVCPWCQGKQLRRVRADGTIVYENGDRTSSLSPSTTCNCGHKHFWDGLEYDSPPKIFKVPLVWKGLTIEEEVVWFQSESEVGLNSNAFKIAESLVNKHYPGEFGNEQLVQKVVESILQNTASKESAFQPPSMEDMPSTSQSAAGSSSSPQHRGASPRHRTGPGEAMETTHSDRAESPGPGKQPGAKSKEGSPSRASTASSLPTQPPSKIILSGSSKSLHKEELTMSETERSLRKRISENAHLQQRHHHTGPEGETSDVSKSAPSGREPKTVSMETETAPSRSETIEPPRDIRIKLSSSEGKHATLVLDPAIGYAQLQSLIEAKLHVPPARQRIKYGFPPKELRAPPSGDEGPGLLPLRNGDKVTVEVIQEGPRTDAHHSAGIASNKQKRIGSSESSHSQQAMLKEFQKGFERIADSEGDNLEVQLTSHNLMATLSRMDLWNYSKLKPELFERGGLFYRIVERDLGLEDGKHCMLPSIPDKRFRFSKANDRLELCLEPLGHYPISTDVDDLEKLKDIAVSQASLGLGQRSLEMSESDITAEDQPSSSSGYVAFAGRGHSLSVVGGTDGWGKGVGVVASSEKGAKLKKYQKCRHDSVESEEEGTREGEKGAIAVEEGSVQFEGSHIPGEKMEHPQGEVEQAGSGIAKCASVDHSMLEGGSEKGVGYEGSSGGAVGGDKSTRDVDRTIAHEGECSIRRDTPMDVEGEEEGREPLLVDEPPPPMEVDLPSDATIDAPHNEAALDTNNETSNISATDGGITLQRTIDLGTSQTSERQDTDNSVEVSQSPSESQPEVSVPEAVIGSESEQASELANQEPAYEYKRLGPGYTVLVRKENGKS